MLKCKAMKNGVSLIQIMIGISVAALLAILAIPNVVHSRLATNETAAITTLKYIAQAQEYFREDGKKNEDGDDSGEYGTIAELSAVTLSPGGKPFPAYLDERFQKADASGIVETRGYRFGVFLPEKPRASGNLNFTVADMKEAYWCAYAWPSEPAKTGNRVFFINEIGLVYGAEAAQMPGPPAAGTAYSGEPFGGTINLLQWMLVR